jgi:hypothetical protein
MSTSPEPDAARSPRVPRWTQPVPTRADQNLKLVQRKIDQNLKPDQPGGDVSALAARMRLPGLPHLMAQLVQPGEIRHNLQDAPPVQAPQIVPTNAEATNTDEPETPHEPETTDETDDFLAKAWEERMAKQWEDVTARLCRDFAPNGGEETEMVLRHIEEQRRLLDDATVRDYLPVLVDRAVRKILSPDENPTS